ncbi:hypothetical protein MMC28_004886 [Mycoblastus sanguinarius]|nr:hypothetical protein [Mycoblastus sanguinarius]
MHLPNLIILLLAALTAATTTTTLEERSSSHGWVGSFKTYQDCGPTGTTTGTNAQVQSAGGSCHNITINTSGYVGINWGSGAYAFDAIQPYTDGGCEYSAGGLVEKGNETFTCLDIKTIGDVWWASFMVPKM